MPPPEDESFPDTPPEEEACLRIMFDYQQGRITLDEAAPRLQAAFRALPGPINLTVSPAIRRLFAEVARLDGRPMPLVGPDPDRHKDGGRFLVHHLAEQAWRAVSKHPRANQPLRIEFHFAAATESTARSILAWLQSHGQERIRLESPVEADADDWMVWASTPATQFSRDDTDRWAAMVRDAPIGSDASFMGWGV